jgi:hypothetical protein
MLVVWKLWIERNARILKHVSTIPMIVFIRIKMEARTWVTAGAKQLGVLILGRVGDEG